ncbi:beta-galactosidase [Planctomonas sp. JC2975]|uniref:beta-galactosidase n=1 Tax=Planctomonas sp. JC2975 TaxID=2729626 RepID=UPI001F0D573E|nr:beta-galactosidase [Planctomonas sp. JC2975]
MTDELGLCFGGDYNPEQWPREVWTEDVDLMVRAGVNFVTVGVWSWSTIEPVPGKREFGWLDEVLDLLHGSGIAVDLATPTASPPPWLGIRHPETLPVNRDGVRLAAGSRNHYSPASAVYREHALAITRDLAGRYATHPAVRMWHVGNEYGEVDYGDEAAREFRSWLRAKYGSIAALNEAWGTAVWSQGYASFDEIVPPRAAPYLINPAQKLDFKRYSSDQLLACYRDQRDAIRAAGATQPITTNFMGFFHHVDYWSWAGDVDVVADDQYPDPASPDAPSDTALVQDLMRSLGGGRPWLLMEQAISAVSWREHNVPKSPADARLNSFQAVARGAEGVCYFQWRQARSGPERFHSALLPHAGADTDVFRGAELLGADLKRMRQVVGGRVTARVGILFDWPSWWAGEEDAVPSARLRTLEQLRRWYRVLWRHGVAAEVVRSGSELSGYDVVLVPHSYVIEPDSADALSRATAAGTLVVVGPFSGVADASTNILQGRFPVLLRHLVGVSGEEWGGLPDQPTPLAMEADWDAAPSGGGTATVIGERLRTEGAEVLARFAGGPYAGHPAITRNTHGAGTAWYLGAVLSDDLLAAVLEEALREAGVTNALGASVLPGNPLPDGLEAVRRGPALFLINHGHESARIQLPVPMSDLLTNEEVDRIAALPPRTVQVLIEGRTT